MHPEHEQTLGLTSAQAYPRAQRTHARRRAQGRSTVITFDVVAVADGWWSFVNGVSAGEEHGRVHDEGEDKTRRRRVGGRKRDRPKSQEYGEIKEREKETGSQIERRDT
eukprot:6187742-Pleurochrysis_carterae.AAC.3